MSPGVKCPRLRWHSFTGEAGVTARLVSMPRWTHWPLRRDRTPGRGGGRACFACTGAINPGFVAPPVHLLEPATGGDQPPVPMPIQLRGRSVAPGWSGSRDTACSGTHGFCAVAHGFDLSGSKQPASASLPVVRLNDQHTTVGLGPQWTLPPGHVSVTALSNETVPLQKP